MKQIFSSLLIVVLFCFASCKTTDDFARAKKRVDSELMRFDKQVVRQGDITPELISTNAKAVALRLRTYKLSEEQIQELTEYYTRSMESYIKQY